MSLFVKFIAKHLFQVDDNVNSVVFLISNSIVCCWCLGKQLNYILTLYPETLL